MAARALPACARDVAVLSLSRARPHSQESVELGVPAALELWLAEDHARLEPKLTQREPVAQLVALYARIAQVSAWRGGWAGWVGGASRSTPSSPR